MYFLEDEIVGLRALNMGDVNGNYSSWFNDPEVCKYNSHHKFPMYPNTIEAYIKSLSDDKSKIVLAVEEKSSKTHIGNISLQQIDLMNRQAEIAFMFGERSYWGKGYATLAARLLIDHAFKELGMNRIFFGTSELNKGMQKVGKHLGFKNGGMSRQALYKDGRFFNIYHYDLLREEWVSDD